VDWLKLSVDLPDHPKVAELSDRAFRALIASWCYAARFETDEGHVPDTASKATGLTARAAAELEAAGLIHRNGSGWHMHDWSHHQADLEAAKRRRAHARKRQADLRLRRKENPSA
jgi:hypothetical protein